MSIEIRQSVETMEGDGATVKRLMPVPGFMNFDPFVLWDHFEIGPDAGFPDHPHRGFEAITYMFQGEMQHKDNLGNESIVHTGGAQRFTAGSGLVHSEMPGSSGHSTGIQLWINLPLRLKNTTPGYQQVDAESFPELKLDKGLLKTIVGEGSPLKLLTPIRYLDVHLNNSGNCNIDVPAGFRGFIYVVEGNATVNNNNIKQADGCFFSEITTLEICGLPDIHFMLCMGQPHGEPIRQRGPYVD